MCTGVNLFLLYFSIVEDGSKVIFYLSLCIDVKSFIVSLSFNSVDIKL